MNQNIDMAQLLATWERAKREAEAARLFLSDIEAAIVGSMPKKDEGSVSETFGEIKVTVTHKINRKVDTAALQGAWEQLTPHAKACFKWAADVAIKDMRACQDMDPASYAEAARFITAQPAKPALKIERI